MRIAKLWAYIIVLFIFSFIFGMGFPAPLQLYMIESTHNLGIRYSLVGLSYNLSQAIFGGTAPIIGTAITVKTHNMLWVGVYLASICFMVSIVLLWDIKNSIKNNETLKPGQRLSQTSSIDSSLTLK